jgi:hypothetical protein
MPQEQLIRVMEVMCFAGAGLGVLVGMLGYLVLKGFSLIDARFDRLEKRVAKFQEQDAWDSEETH